MEQCLRSVLKNDYPRLEVIVVDDASTDRTGEIARKVAAADGRLKVIATSRIPEGWFGKQWACETGARASDGEIILFADADTRHSRDLVTRSVNAMFRRNADLFSVMGRQELGSFWERLVQPQVFALLLTRYGGTETVSNARSVKDKIANGQCLFVRRDTYDELGGHAIVKSHVAEDMMMAQRWFARGKRIVLEEGRNHLSTRMYTSLGELIRGWGKNVYAGGRDAMPLGIFGRLLFPLLLLLGPLVTVVAALVLAASLFLTFPPAIVLWSVIAQAALLAWWMYMYVSMEESPAYALLSPLGAAMVFYIFVRAIIRGERVTWKGREYVSR